MSGRFNACGKWSNYRTIIVIGAAANNYYWNNFIAIHGITPQQTAHAPTFDLVWKQIKPHICKQNVVAHNGFAFDFQCLKQTLAYYRLAAQEYIGHCTYKIYKENLKSLCKKHNITLKHHDALSDAKACAELYLKQLK